VEQSFGTVPTFSLCIKMLGRLARGWAGPPLERQVAWSKELLWRIGQMVDALLEGRRKELLGPQGGQSVWGVVASMADHKLGGDKLQRMYQAMKEKGYQPPGGRIGEFPAGEGGSTRCR
jgi:hypothetical protein